MHTHSTKILIFYVLKTKTIERIGIAFFYSHSYFILYMHNKFSYFPFNVVLCAEEDIYSTFCSFAKCCQNKRQPINFSARVAFYVSQGELMDDNNRRKNNVI